MVRRLNPRESDLSLERRHQIERQFHDSKAGRSSAQSNSSNFYAAGGLDTIWADFLRMCGDFDGLTVLDFGCGEGWSSLVYARRGATVHAFDISQESVCKLAQNATKAGLAEQIHPSVMAAEQLEYPQDFFDLVLGVSILHHTDLDLVGPEISRVLKPEGRGIFIEPLDHNWILRLFRWLTPSRRTPTERPLSVHQILALRQHFRRVAFRGFYLLSVVPQGFLLLTGNRTAFRWCLRAAEALDRRLIKTFPSLERFCWSAIVEVEK